MNAALSLFPVEVSTVALTLVGAMWLVTFLAAIYRWRIFYRIQVVYRFSTEFERRVHRRFSDSNRQRAPFASVLAKLADAATAAVAEDGDTRRARRLERRYRKNSGDEMLALLQRTLIGEAVGWNASKETSSSPLATIGHAVRFALNENPVLARLGIFSLSFVHRATDCAPWAMLFVSCGASAALIAMSLQLVGGPQVFNGPSFLGLALCLAPIVTASLATAFLYIFFRFFDPERLYDRTVQKLTGALEVLWQDAGQAASDGESRLPVDVNAPVPLSQLEALSRDAGVTASDVRFLVGDGDASAPVGGSDASVATVSAGLGVHDAEAPWTKRGQGAVERTVPPADRVNASASERPVDAMNGPESERPVDVMNAPESERPVDAMNAPESERPVDAMNAPESAEAMRVAPDDRVAETTSAPPSEAFGETDNEEPDEITVLSELPAQDRCPPPAVAPASVTGDASGAMPFAAEPRVAPPPPPIASIPAMPSTPPSTAAMPAAPSSTAGPDTAQGQEGSLEDWTLSAPLSAGRSPSTTPTVAPAGAGGVGGDEGSETVPQFTLPAEVADVPSPLWPASPAAPTPAPSPASAEAAGSDSDEVTLWNASPVPPAGPALTGATPTVTVRRAGPRPVVTASSENTGEWGSETPPEPAQREEITQEVPLRPVATPGSGKPATIVRRAAPAAPAPSSPPSSALWSSSAAPSARDDDRIAVLRHRLSIVEQYLQKATLDFSQGTMSEAMWQEETERWSLEREKLVREIAQLTARKRSDAA